LAVAGPRYHRRQGSSGRASLASRGGLDIQAVVAGCSTSARIVAAACHVSRRSIERGGQAVAPTGRDRISLVICASGIGSEKRNPAKAGIKFVHFGGILQTAGDRGGSGSRLASPCPVRRALEARGSKRDINCNLPTGAANVTDCPSTKCCESSGTVPRQVQLPLTSRTRLAKRDAGRRASARRADRLLRV
jgi:hypothetical protein